MISKKILIPLIVLLLLSCAEDDPPTIKIGVSLPETGFAATMGEYIHHGMELALDNLPENERDSYQIIYEDDQCDPTIGLTVARKLVESDQVHFIVGPFCAAVITSTMDYYDSHKIVRMITGLGADTFTNEGSYRFILLGEVQDLMKPLAEHAYRKGLRRMGILYLDDDYGKENMIYFTKWFEQSGGTILAAESFLRNQAEFRTHLLKLRTKKIDGIFIAALGVHLVNIVKQMDELNFDIPIYSLRNIEDPEIIQVAKDSLEGIFFPSITPQIISERHAWFTQQYFKKYGKPAESVAANAFDSLILLTDAIKECKTDFTCVEQKINQLGYYEGASGKFTLDKRRVAERDPIIRVVKNNTFHLAE